MPSTVRILRRRPARRSARRGALVAAATLTLALAGAGCGTSGLEPQRAVTASGYAAGLSGECATLGARLETALDDAEGDDRLRRAGGLSRETLSRMARVRGPRATAADEEALDRALRRTAEAVRPVFGFALRSDLDKTRQAIERLEGEFSPLRVALSKLGVEGCVSALRYAFDEVIGSVYVEELPALLEEVEPELRDFLRAGRGAARTPSKRAVHDLPFLRSYIQEIEALTPPAELRGEHRALLRALEGLDDAANDLDSSVEYDGRRAQAREAARFGAALDELGPHALAALDELASYVRPGATGAIS